MQLIEPWKRRLFPLIDNPQGKAFSECEKRFIVCVAGRRSGGLRLCLN
jgi:hypothetical protein